MRSIYFGVGACVREPWSYEREERECRTQGRGAINSVLDHHDYWYSTCLASLHLAPALFVLLARELASPPAGRTASPRHQASAASN